MDERLGTVMSVTLTKKCRALGGSGLNRTGPSQQDLDLYNFYIFIYFLLKSNIHDNRHSPTI